jgi:hypothetical protein
MGKLIWFKSNGLLVVCNVELLGLAHQRKDSDDDLDLEELDPSTTSPQQSRESRDYTGRKRSYSRFLELVCESRKPCSSRFSRSASVSSSKPARPDVVRLGRRLGSRRARPQHDIASAVS